MNNKYMTLDPLEMLEDAHNKINTLIIHYNELGKAHNNLVANCQRLENELNVALDAIHNLQKIQASKL